jgi:uncharacterized membrane protein YgaE (UPF0421/DUF939 family)
LEGNLNSTNNTVYDLTSNIEEKINTSVHNQISAYTSTFENKFQHQLNSTAALLDSKNEERILQFRQEHQRFVHNFEEVQKEQRTQYQAVSELVTLLKKPE